IGNAFGDQADLRGMDFSWRGHWQWHTDITDTRWTGLLKATFAGIEMTAPTDYEVWGLNLINEHANAAFSPTQRYHDHRSFGEMRFERGAPVIRPDHLDIQADV